MRGPRGACRAVRRSVAADWLAFPGALRLRFHEVTATAGIDALLVPGLAAVTALQTAIEHVPLCVKNRILVFLELQGVAQEAQARFRFEFGFCLGGIHALPSVG